MKKDKIINEKIDIVAIKNTHQLKSIRIPLNSSKK